MKVLTRGITPNGTPIQIEEWNENYGFIPYGSTVASYPKSKASHEGTFSPKGNEVYRLSFNFNSEIEAKSAFDGLKAGVKELADYKTNMDNPKYADCI